MTDAVAGSRGLHPSLYYDYIFNKTNASSNVCRLTHEAWIRQLIRSHTGTRARVSLTKRCFCLHTIRRRIKFWGRIIHSVNTTLAPILHYWSMAELFLDTGRPFAMVLDSDFASDSSLWWFSSSIGCNTFHIAELWASRHQWCWQCVIITLGNIRGTHVCFVPRSSHIGNVFPLPEMCLAASNFNHMIHDY